MRRTKRVSLCLLLTSVALLLGILGMHAVDGGANAPGVDHAAAAAAVAVDGAGSKHPTAVDAVAQHVGAPRLAGMPLPDAPDGPAAAAAAVCVAVLVGLVSMLGIARSRPAQAASAPRQPRQQVLRRRALTGAPPPDLLTRLCVLRT